MRFVARSLSAVAILAALATGAVGWHVAKQIHDRALLPSHDLVVRTTYDDAIVTAVDSGSVTLELRANEHRRAERVGTWGLLWDGGGGRIDSILSRHDRTITRRFTLLAGSLKVSTDVDVRFEPFTGDPQTALGRDFIEISIPSSPSGRLPAWEIPGSRDAWAICVHGKGAGRTQMLRESEQYAERGYTVLVPSYRNDTDAPPSADHLYHFGLTEWRDLESAIRYARERGAKSMVLHGFSMGGGIVVATLERSPLASDVSAVVLDSPMLDFGATIDWGLRRERIPYLNAPVPSIAGVLGKSIVAWRYHVDWDSLDLLRDIDATSVPFLVLHGDDDSIVPLETSQSLAERLPDGVTFVRFPGAEHGEAWNVDPERYGRVLDEFLAQNVP